MPQAPCCLGAIHWVRERRRMAVAVILLILGFIYLSAYHLAMQRTLGLLLTGRPKAEDRSRAQVAIIFGLQLTRLNVTFLLGVAIYLIIARASAWYFGVMVLALCQVGGLLVQSILNLQPGSPKMLAMIASDLERRRTLYMNKGDSLRLQAVEGLLAQLRSIPRFR